MSNVNAVLSFQMLVPPSGFTSQQVKYSNAKCWGEASAEASTETSQTSKHDQTQ